MNALATTARPRVRERATNEYRPVGIYHGTVQHERLDDGPRVFTPRLFLAYLDVDALPSSLDAIPFWSARRRAPVHFCRRDFFDRSERPLGGAVRDLVEGRLGFRPAGSIFLLAQPRTFGWLANPLAVYYCWNAAHTGLEAIVLEVTNTPWGERHWYVFDARDGRTRACTAKAMPVSPFLPMNVDYDVAWSAPGERLTLRVAVQRAGNTTFTAMLDLERAELNRHTARGLLRRYPFLPLRVSAGIYGQALRLYLRGTTFYPHPRRQERRNQR